MKLRDFYKPLVQSGSTSAGRLDRKKQWQLSAVPE